MNKRFFFYKNKLIRQFRDIHYSIKYGRNAPKYGDLIYIDPNKVIYYSSSKRSDFGLVKSGNWDQQENLSLYKESIKYRACSLRWEEEYTWKETGIYSHIMELIENSKNKRVDNCTNLEEVKQRYERLDKLFNEIKTTRKFKTRKELNSSNYREQGGVYISIGRENQIIFWGSGWHRLAIAKILKLEKIPAQVALIHPKAIKKWKAYKNND